MGRDEMRELVIICAAGCVAVSLVVGAAALGLYPAQHVSRLNAIAERLDAIDVHLALNDEKLRAAGLIPRTLAALDRRISDIDTRVRYPRYARHVDGCPQCRGDVPNEEGGPSSLCVEGFEVWKSDMRAERERRSPASDKLENTKDSQ